MGRLSGVAMPPRQRSSARGRGGNGVESFGTDRRHWVISRHADLGDIATGPVPLVTIVDLGRLRVEAEVDEFDFAGVAMSAKVIITAEGYSSAGWQGQVEEVPQAVVGRLTRPDDPGRPADTRVLRVKVAFREPNPLKLGQHVEVEIARGGKKP